MAKLIGTEEYAALCGVSAMTIRNRIKAGKIAAKEVSGSYLIDVEAYPPQGAMKAGRKKASELANN